jgi:hypothetical protein
LPVEKIREQPLSPGAVLIMAAVYINIRRRKRGPALKCR